MVNGLYIICIDMDIGLFFKLCDNAIRKNKENRNCKTFHRGVYLNLTDNQI